MIDGILATSTERGAAIAGVRETATPRRIGDTSPFKEVFASAGDEGRAAPSRAAAKPALTTVAARPSPTLAEALDAFEKEAQMTPRERIRRDVLKENKLTEESLAAMEPNDRDAAEKTIKAEVDRRLAAVEEEARRKDKTIGLAAML